MSRNVNFRTAFTLLVLILCVGIAANAFAATADTVKVQVTASSQNPSNVGQSVQFTIKVTDTQPAPGSAVQNGFPGGTLSLYLGSPNTAASTCTTGGGTLLGSSSSATMSGSGADNAANAFVATYTISTSALPAGSGQTISACFASGDNTATGWEDQDTGGTGGATLSQTVNNDNTSISLASTPNPSYPTQSVTFTATVTDTTNGATIPTGGAVHFYAAADCSSGGELTGSPVTLSAGAAQLAITTLTAGTHGITACYDGTTGFNPPASPSNTVSQVVQTDTTTTSVSSNANPSNIGQSVTFTATVTDIGGLGVPVGKAHFFDGASDCAGTGGVELAGSPVTLDGTGKAQLSISTLSRAGSPHSITACYESTNTNGWTSSTVPSSAVSQVVNVATTTTALIANTSSTLGKNTDFQAQVSSPTDTTDSFTGIVQFKDNGVVIGSATISGLSGAVSTTFSTSLLPLGAGHDITATFIPNTASSATFSGSSSPSPFAFTVNARGAQAAVQTIANVPVRGPAGPVNVNVQDTDNSGTVGTFVDATHALVTARTGHTATLLPDGRVLVVGGSGTVGGAALANGSPEVYTPGAGFTVFTPGTGTFLGRIGAAATRLNDGRVLIVGGTDGTTVFADADIYDPKTDTVTNVPAFLGSPLMDATATTLANGDVVIAGGEASSSGSALQAVWLYNGTTVVPAGNLAVARSGHTATLLISGTNAGKILMTGGTGSTASAELYTIAGGIATTAPPTARTLHAATAMPDGTVLVSGGMTSTPAVKSVELYDPFTGTFTAVAATFTTGTAGRSAFTQTSLDNGQILVVGGFDSAATNAVTVNSELYTPSYDPQGALTLASDNGGSSVADDLVACTTLTLTGTGTSTCAGTVLPWHVGGSTHKITASYNAGTVNPNHSLSNDNTGQQLTVNPKAITVTAVIDTKTYDGTALASSIAVIPNVTGLLTNKLGNADTNNSVQAFNVATTAATTTIPTALFKDANDGSTVTSDYTITPVDGAGSITKAHLTVTADPQSKTYDNTAFSGTYTTTITGFVNSETSAVVSGTAAFSGTAIAAVNAGSYTITPAVGTLTATNYDFTTFNNGTLTINKVHLTVTADNQAKTYDTQIFPPASYTVTITGPFVGTDTSAVVTGSAGFTGNSQAATNAGTYTITPTVGTLTATNYDFTTFNNGTLTINKVHLNVKADDQLKNYDGATFTAFTSTITGFVSPDTVAVVSGSPSYSGTATAAVNAGSYTITPAIGTLSATNYDFPPANFTSGTLQINKVHLTVTADPKSKTFDGAIFSGTYTATITGFVNSETAAVVSGAPAFSGTALAATNAGSYTITPAVGTLTATNYDFTTFVDGTLAINKAHLTVTADPQAKTYDGLVFAGPYTATISGFVAPDTVAVVSGAAGFSGAASTATNVGGYTITPTPGSLTAANYDFPVANMVNGTLTINKAHLTVTADPKSRVYGAADPVFTATVSGFANGETLATSGVSGTAACTTVATATSTVAGSPYAINCTLGTLTAGNYDFPTFVPGGLTITLAPLTITATNQGKQYGNVFNFAGTEFTTAGLLNGDSVSSVTLTSAGSAAVATFTSPGPAYPIVPSAAVGTNLGNYAITYVNGTMTLTQAPLTVTASNQTKVYGNVFAFAGTEFTTSGLLNADTVTSATLTSTGSPAAATFVSPGPTYPILASAAVGGGLGNYNITYAPGTLTLTKAPLTVTAKDQNKVVNTTFVFAGTEFTTTGLKNSDAVTSAALSSLGSVSTASTTGGNKPAGSNRYDIVIASPAGSGLANYTITLVNGTMTVGAAPSVTIIDAQSVLSSGNGAFTFTATVTPQNPGLIPTGTVTFQMDGAAGPFSASYSCVTSTTACKATATAVVLPAGSHTIKATFNPAGTDFASSNGAVAATVIAPLNISPGNTSSLTANISYPGSNITITGYTPAPATLPLNNVNCVIVAAAGTVAQPPTCKITNTNFPITITASAATAALTIAINTQGVTGASLQPGPLPKSRFGGLLALSMGMPAIVFMGLAVPLGTLRRKALRVGLLRWFGMALVLAVLLAAVGCGGGFSNPNNAQPVVSANASTPGKYTAVINYTDSTGTHALASVDFVVAAQ